MLDLGINPIAMNRFFFFALSVLLLLSRTGRAQPNASSDQVNAYARQEFEAGVTRFSEKKIDEAIALFTDAIDSATQFTVAYNFRGIAHCEAGHFYDAIEDFNAAIAKRPDYALAYNNRGYVLLLIGGLEKAALADFTKAIELKPDFAKAYYNRGIALELLRRDNSACRDWQKARELQMAVPDDFFKTCKDDSYEK